MSDRLKFRAWDGHRFVQVNSIEIVEAKSSVTGKFGYNINLNLGVPANYLQRYVGCCDEKKQDIYEGDILVYHDQEGDFVQRSVDSKPYEVFWDNQWHRWAARRKQIGYAEPYDVRILSWNHFEYLVVGNIFENHKLLKSITPRLKTEGLVTH